MAKAHQREVEVAWAAGLVDGEGCIRLGKHGAVILHVEQVQLQALRKLKQVLGGSIYRYERPRCTVYRWCAGGDQVAVMLKQLHPYLTVKRAEASTLLQYLQFRQDNGSGHGRRSPELERRMRRTITRLGLLKRRVPGTSGGHTPSAHHPGAARQEEKVMGKSKKPEPSKKEAEAQRRAAELGKRIKGKDKRTTGNWGDSRSALQGEERADKRAQAIKDARKKRGGK